MSPLLPELEKGLEAIEQLLPRCGAAVVAAYEAFASELRSGDEEAAYRRLQPLWQAYLDDGEPPELNRLLKEVGPPVVLRHFGVR